MTRPADATFDKNEITALVEIVAALNPDEFDHELAKAAIHKCKFLLDKAKEHGGTFSFGVTNL